MSNSRVQLEVVALRMYPVKSCAGIDMAEMDIGERGPMHDREWMWVDSTHRFITQRQHPEMALVRTALDSVGLTLSAPGVEPLRIPHARTERREIDVTVWSDTCRAIDEGDHTTAWLKRAIGIDARLVRIAPEFRRPLPEKYSRPGTHTGFADTLPFLITSEESLADLNARLPEKLSMDRFRPNVVVRGGTAYAEDQWKLIRLGAVELDLARDCTRCAIITIDPVTAKTGKEPLRTLALYRREGTRIKFGRNAIHLMQGKLKVGDRGEVLKLKQP